MTSQKKRIKILVCCHKQDIRAKQDPYSPIHVGKAISDKELGIPTDDSGNNISAKNQSYCELTGMYWAWKNLKNIEIIGLCHYRRYFDFHNQGRKGFPQTNIPSDDFDKIDLSIPQRIIEKIQNGSVIVAKPYPHWRFLVDDYCFNHISDDLRTLEQILKTSQTKKIKEAYFKYMYQNHTLRHYNMFIMKWKDFDEYCTWLFDILARLEAKTDISHYNPVQRRIYGYVAERLLNVWLEARQKDIIEKPILWFTDAPDVLRHYNRITFKVRCFINDIAFKLLKPRTHFLLQPYCESSDQTFVPNQNKPAIPKP